MANIAGATIVFEEPLLTIAGTEALAVARHGNGPTDGFKVVRGNVAVAGIGGVMIVLGPDLTIVGTGATAVDAIGEGATVGFPVVRSKLAVDAAGTATTVALGGVRLIANAMYAFEEAVTMVQANVPTDPAVASAPSVIPNPPPRPEVVL